MSNSTRKKELLKWIDDILEQTGMSATELAKRAGISTSTITRMQEPGWKGNMRSLTIKAIAEAANTRPPTAMLPEPQGFADRDVEAYPAPDKIIASNPTMKRFAAEDAGNNAHVLMILQTDALTGAGLFPGDQMVLDLNRQAASGDIVCAQAYDWRNGTAETIIRIYEPPYLIAHNLNRKPIRPLLVDKDNVKIKGVFTWLDRNLVGAA